MLINAAVHGFNAIDGGARVTKVLPSGHSDDSRQYLRRRYYQRMDLRIELIFSDTKRLDRDRVGEIRCSPLERPDPFTFTDRKYKTARLRFSIDTIKLLVSSLHFREESHATRSRVAAVVGGRH
ncbi:PREDICTED: uncharacterized protein LOC105568138 [Vollenhovia emeryi]|uniref:uncharacterized protein LOC105568138 n=1 Tax=Vollenhovia emeryi TaxID=411798 RepID=UPI0005F49AB8|nr:PREDICTED: uncharacterized protein LOC105568138 [Vollenhovia emeryi]